MPRYTIEARSRTGFTLVELLVSTAIIAVLIAFLLPAVQQIREAARKTQCRSNVRQLLLAMHNYHDGHGTFPLNYGQGLYTSGNVGQSWLSRILPEIEQSALSRNIDSEQPLSFPANTRVARTPLAVFQCPSDSGTSGVADFRANVPGTWGVNNYKACAGSNWDWGTFAPVVSTSGRHVNDPDGLDHGNGLICRNAGNQPFVTRLSDVTDGTSQTYALGEAVPQWSRHTWWYWFNASTGTCAIPLNFRREPDLQLSMDGDWWHNYSFSSRHVGGAHFGFADGSSRFVNEKWFSAIRVDGMLNATRCRGSVSLRIVG